MNSYFRNNLYQQCTEPAKTKNTILSVPSDRQQTKKKKKKNDLFILSIFQVSLNSLSVLDPKKMQLETGHTAHGCLQGCTGLHYGCLQGCTGLHCRLADRVRYIRPTGLEGPQFYEAKVQMNRCFDPLSPYSTQGRIAHCWFSRISIHQRSIFITSKMDRQLIHQKVRQRIPVMKKNNGVFVVFKKKRELKSKNELFL